MLVTVGDQPSLFESVLPPELLRLPAELARVDQLLDDPGVLRTVGAVLRSADGSPLDPDGDLSAADVPQVPLRVRVRDAVPGGQ